ncbi:Replication factor A [uncultured archaeon]|nr:Replication factor A [uncultured archaeon]
MPMENYERIIEKISKLSNIPSQEIERKIEAKRAKLSGLISREGAAQVIAAELGISFDNEKLKIEELLPGMRKVNVVGKVIGVSPVRTFKTKKGDDGKVANLFLADETSNIKVVLWDTNNIHLIETGEIAENVVVEISNGSMRDNELHLGSFSAIKATNDSIGEIKTGKVFREKTISELKNSDNVRVRAFVVQTFEPRFFYVCPSCKKKAVQEDGGFVCAEHGKVSAEKRALLNIIIDDGTETIKTVAFQDNLASLGITEFENMEELINQREKLLGKEMFFHGTVRNNKLFNTPEFIIEKAEDIDSDLLIKELEN